MARHYVIKAQDVHLGLFCSPASNLYKCLLFVVIILKDLLSDIQLKTVRNIMKKVLVAILLVMLMAVTASASELGDRFKKIQIVDDIIIFTDVDDMIQAPEVKAHALKAFNNHMRGMIVNDNAYVDNYPAEGYTLENVGYIIMKVMSIRTKGGVNAYHVGFEFGIPPRQVYWDTATMGIAPTTFDFKKELFEDIDEIMESFATAFYKERGE